MKTGDIVSWKKLEGESRRADWTGVVLKVTDDAVIVEWTRDGDTSGKTKVQRHAGADKARVLLKK